MHVIDHEPHSWFLFQDDADLLLDVNCEHNSVGFSILIRLTVEEASEYVGRGHAYVNELARAVQYSGPKSDYQSRNISGLFGTEALEAVTAWRDA